MLHDWVRHPRRLAMLCIVCKRVWPPYATEREVGFTCPGPPEERTNPMRFVTCPVCGKPGVPVGAGGQLQEHKRPVKETDNVRRFGKLQNCTNKNP